MVSEMEKILGGPIGLEEIIPGSVLDDRKEYIYFCDDGRNSAEELFDALTQYTNPPNAQSGGAGFNGISLTLPDGSVFFAIYYHGDIPGWRKDIEAGASGLGVTLARIADGKIVVDDGRVHDLSECIPMFPWKRPKNSL